MGACRQIKAWCATIRIYDLDDFYGRFSDLQKGYIRREHQMTAWKIRETGMRRVERLSLLFISFVTNWWKRRGHNGFEGIFSEGDAPILALLSV